ncbi:hypothetical protein MAF45_09570 [Mesosutterella sp. OilRF-GAM-744-9]|uniref:Uncharacterized protein n=1 Tax=Mesosutterella porci TaxID=2915351 RepID=A0ABS9MSU3_9BURK|nr:hypothetical protein [Mesosutterella sp. oilRF-744-WT-GAM-9]
MAPGVSADMKERHLGLSSPNIPDPPNGIGQISAGEINQVVKSEDCAKGIPNERHSSGRGENNGNEHAKTGQSRNDLSKFLHDLDDK